MNKNMHIGLVLPAVPSYSETFFRNKIIGLQAVGIKVTLFANGPSKKFNLCPYYAQPPVHSLFSFGWIKIFYFFVLVFVKRPNVLRRLFILDRVQGKSIVESVKTILANSHILWHKVDWLHFGFGTMALGKENLAKAMGAKMAVSLRGFDIAIYPLKQPGCYQLMWSNLDKLHVISLDLKVLAIKNGLPPKTNVQVINPAIDIKKFNCTRQLNQALSGPLKILTVARLHWKKGLECTIQSLSILHKKNIPFEYTIIGEGEEYERLVFAAYQLGIKDQVFFIGKKNPEEVKKAMEKCDIYLQYSISEGFCNAVLEAQAMGCLCVVSDAEGLAENVIDGETGWVVQKKQPEELAKTIIQVTQTDIIELINIRLKAINRVKETFNLEKQVNQFQDFYKMSD